MMENKKYNCIFYTFIFMILALPIVSIGENLGLYFDSVFPDYAATQLLDSQTHEVKWFAAWPILTQVYHGSVNLFISALVIMIMGTTSVIQHRLINAFIITLCFYVIDNIWGEFTKNQRIRHLFILVFAFMPTMLGFCLTQYYIELPGVAAVLMALLLLIRHQKASSNLKVWGCFAFLGFAFYCYFNFLFLIPGFIFAILLKCKDRKERINNVILAGIGVLPGASLYLLGYLKILYCINNNFAFIAIVFFALIVAIEFAAYKLIMSDKQHVIAIFFGVILLCLVVAVILFRENILATLSSLNAAGDSATLLVRIKLLYDNVFYAVGGVSSELLMLGYSVTKWARTPIIIIAIILALYIVLLCMNKEFRKMSKAWEYVMIILIYLCCCIPLITRMQAQHFVPIAFLLLVVTGIEVLEIVGFINIINNTVYKKVAVVCGISLALLFASDRYRVVDEIFETGGNGYYTCQINKLAKEALDNLDKGEKQIYIFPEWGFMTGFNYITNNNVAFSTDCSEYAIKTFLSEEYEIEILYWEAEEAESCINLIKEMGINNINLVEYKGRDGAVEFYRVEIY